MTPFTRFSKLLNAQFQRMSQHELYTVNGSGDDLWAAYLAGFPAGTNPTFRERTEHDCSCCRNFIKNIGNVVAIIDGVQVSVWDIEGAEYPYNEVTEYMSRLLRAVSISGLYRTSEKTYGAEFNFERVEGAEPIKWNHYHGAIAAKHFTKDVGSIVGAFNTTAAVFRRGLEELTPEAFTTVVGLIEANNLYRGEEFLAAVKGFQKLQNEYIALPTWAAQHLFVWNHAEDPATRFRNTAMGTLVQDLSEGMPLEKAVASFEAKVAPTNYKRTTALITPAMINKAMETIEAMGLRAALDRRFAKLSDISVNNVLWVNREVRGQMKDSLTTLLMASATVPDHTGPIEEISIADFMENVVPHAAGIEAMVKNAMSSNFVSLTAPVHADSGELFKWANNFAWSYDGNITDSDIRKAVQGRGGRVDGVFRFSHSWNYDKRNASLMDLHVFMPGNSHPYTAPCHDNYGNGTRVGWNNRSHMASGGVQDVDYTHAAPEGYVPVENITFPSMDKLADGDYICKVHNWNLRAPTSGGFRAEIEFGGQLFEYEYAAPLKHKEWVTVATVTLKDGVFTIKHHLPSSASTQVKWGVNTEQFVKVNTLMYSPNHWDGQAVGNRHWFFMLDNCLNDEPTRGIYNEFLDNDLNEHRKVFEVLGDKTKCQPTADQLSGIGFSSTRGDKLLVRVTGVKLRKSFNISF